MKGETMKNPCSTGWCRLTWQVLLYLESAYDRLDGGESIIVRDESWGAYTGEQGEKPEANIGFEVKSATEKRTKGNSLWIGLWFTENGVKGDRPIWIQVIRDDIQIWERLKSEFKEALVSDTDDGWAVGLEWTLSDNATNSDVRTAGEELADRVTKVLESR
jgi:hypothetical protein